MAQCKDCRFYEGRRCTARNFSPSAQTASCYSFSAYSTRNSADFKECRDCRFFDGSKCVERNFNPTPATSKCYDGSICK